jgi:hypothetical protein
MVICQRHSNLVFYCAVLVALFSEWVTIRSIVGAAMTNVTCTMRPSSTRL